MKPIKFKTNLVGLAASGPGAGKDTTFNALVAKGVKAANVKFATALEQEVYAQFRGVNEKDLMWIRNDPTAKDQPFHFLSVSAIDAGFENKGYKVWLREDLGFKGLDDPRSIRWHLIQYGTNYIRKHLGKDSYWLDKGLQEAKQITHTTDKTAIVTDVRFPNEARAIKDNGGLLVYLNSPWSQNNNGGIADGLIRPEDCHLIINTIEGNKEHAADVLIDFIKKGPYSE